MFLFTLSLEDHFPFILLSFLATEHAANPLGYHHDGLEGFLYFAGHLFKEMIFGSIFFGFALISLKELLPYLVSSYKKS